MKRESKLLTALGTFIGVSGLTIAGCYYTMSRNLKRNEPSISYEEPAIKTDWIYEIIDKHDPTNREFYRAVIKTESSDNPKAVSKVGARGLMQFMEATWKEKAKLPFEEAFNPETNIEMGIKYMHWIADQLEKNIPDWEKLPKERRLSLIAASYNGGVGRLTRNEFDISKMPKETREYVEKVRKAMSNF